MIKKFCDICGKEVKDNFGSITFMHKVGSAPELTAEIYTHVCPTCFGKMKTVAKRLDYFSTLLQRG